MASFLLLQSIVGTQQLHAVQKLRSFFTTFAYLGGIKGPLDWLPQGQSISRVINVVNTNDMDVSLPLVFEEVSSDHCTTRQNVVRQQTPALISCLGPVGPFQFGTEMLTASRDFALREHELVHLKAAVYLGQDEQFIHLLFQTCGNTYFVCTDESLKGMQHGKHWSRAAQ